MINQNNIELFEAFRSLNFPFGHYVIVGSGPLGIRNLRAMSDVDAVVSEDLWSKLANAHSVVSEPIEKILLLQNKVEVLHEASFGEGYEDSPSVSQQIDQAEMIDGLAFQSLDHLRYFKSHSTREKDKMDIELLARSEH